MIQENKVWKKKISLKVQTILYRSNVQIGIIAALFTIIGAFVLPVRNANEYRVELNEIWNEPDLIAPFDFPIYKSPDSLQKEKKQLIKQLPEVFLENSNQMNQAISGADSFFNQLQHVLKLWQTWQAQKKMNVYRIRSEDTSLYYQKFKQAIHSLRPEVENRLLQYYTQNPIALSTTYTIGRQLIEQIYNVGYINKSISDIHSEVISLRTEGQYERLLAKSRVFDREKVNSAVQTSSQALAPLCQNLLLRFFQYYVQPNYLYNDSIYQLEKQYALNAISPYVSLVRKGELIVAKGAKITKDVANKISSLNKEQQQVPYSQEFWGIHLIGKILLLSLLTAIILLYLSLNRRELFLRWKKIVLLFSIFLVMILLSAVADFFSNTFASLYNVNIFYFIPLCMVPIFITTFFDDRIGFLGNIMIALLVALANHYNFEFFFVQVCAGSVTVFKLKLLRRREHFFSTAAVVFVVYIVAYLSYNFYTKYSWQYVNWANLVLFFINALLTLSAFPLIYILEKFFNLTSDISLIELLDNEHPLLKRLYEKAPGTYQHSLQVAIIAEEVAKKIGAHALLVHVGALFHDIGKIEKPEYFTENQRDNDNHHQDLSPMESAQLIIEHVQIGEKLAREYRLPLEIIEFIRTHHGTTRVEFFYRMYQNQEPHKALEDEHNFRYPGPKPYTREQAILMIADSIEAASRSLASPTQSELSKLIETIIATKIDDKQLSSAPISFRDLDIMKKEILNVLSSIYHNRIKYPEPRTEMIV